MQLDSWQEDFINYQGNKILVSGRQTGKSEAQAYDNAEFAARNPGVNVLLISKTERQSQELLIKTLIYVQQRYPKRIGKGKYKPLKSEIWIMGETKNDPPSRVMCLPTGLAGEGIRGFSIHKLSADEAQLISDDVFTAVTPMLLTTGGKISLSGTPQGKKGFFWHAYENKLQHFKVFHVNSEQVINDRPISDSWPEWRREAALNHLKNEKQRMTDKQYAQEYLGIFVEDLDQVYPDELIEKCCVGKRTPMSGKMYLGVDVGRTVDPSTFEIINANDQEKLIHVDNIVEKGLSIPSNYFKIKDLYKIHKFKKMGVDGGGLGAGVVDLLIRDASVKQKVIDLNNAHRVVKDSDDEKKKKILLKEQMHFNLLSLMHQGKIVLLDDEEIKVSLRSCQMERVENKDDIRIFGSDTHIVEGIIRAAHIAVESKTLNLFATYSGSNKHGF